MESPVAVAPLLPAKKNSAFHWQPATNNWQLLNALKPFQALRGFSG
jgi:hypothetical protein